MTRRRKIAAALAMTAAVAAASPGAAWAHAFLDRAQPPVGGTVKGAPAEVRLRFSETLEPAFSSAEVTDAAGRRVDAGPARIASDSPQEIAVGLKPLPPGTYRVVWRAVSADTHRTEGDFTFTVAPP